MRLRDCWLAVAVAFIAAVLLSVSPASAAVAPINDSIGEAKQIDVTFSEQVDLTAATTDEFDLLLIDRISGTCFYEPPTTSVWYRLRSDEAAEVGIELFSRDVAVWAIVATGTPGNLTPVWGSFCAAPSFEVEPGTDYWVLVFDSGVGGAPIGVSVVDAAAPTTLSISVGGGRVDQRSGVATIAGTLRCTNGLPEGFFSIAQSVGKRGVIQSSGIFFLELPFASACDGTLQSWSMQFAPTGGKFAGGKATLSLRLGACSRYADDQCASISRDEIVQLRVGSG